MPTTDAPVRRPRPSAAGGPTGGTGRRSRGPGERPAAASATSPAWVHGAPGQARVVATFDRAAYLLRDGEVLPVLAPGALALPGGLRLGSTAHLHGLRLRVGADVLVGGGRVDAPGGTLVVRRTWRPVPVPSAAPPAGARTLLPRVLRSLPGLTDDLPPAVLQALPRLLTAGGPAALVGLGPGLTPAGDDLLCGALLALRATGAQAARARLEQSVRPLLHRTTALSATLLRQAALGYAVPPVVDLLRAWHGGAADEQLLRHAEDVAAVGHTSGPALLLGLTAALEHVIPAGAASGRRHAIPTLQRGPS